MEKKNVPTSTRLLELKNRKKNILKRKIFIFILIFLILITCFFFLLRWNRFKISDVEIKGNELLEESVLKEKVNIIIQGHYIYFIPKDNIFLYPERKIKQNLSNEYKRIKDIIFDINKDNKLVINIVEFKGKYLWCGENIKDIEKRECYFMDENGYVFDKSAFFTGDVYFKFFGPLEKNNGNILSSNYLPKYFSDIVTFSENLRKIGISISYLNVKENFDGEFVIEGDDTSLENSKIIFKINDNLKKVIENLEASINTEPLLSSFKNEFKNLEYIDLRFGNKVFYKFKTNEQPRILEKN